MSVSVSKSSIPSFGVLFVLLQIHQERGMSIQQERDMRICDFRIIWQECVLRILADRSLPEAMILLGEGTFKAVCGILYRKRFILLDARPSMTYLSKIGRVMGLCAI